MPRFSSKRCSQQKRLGSLEKKEKKNVKTDSRICQEEKSEAVTKQAKTAIYTADGYQGR